MDLENTVALVCGGGSGLGAGAVRLLLERGANVAVVDVAGSPEGEAFDDGGRRARFFPIDITDADQVAAAFAGVEEVFGRLDIVVNTAGISDRATMLRPDGAMHPLDTFTRVIQVNLIGLFDIVRNGVRLMSRNAPNGDGERGVIINVGSIAAYEGQPGHAAYSASKGAVVAMTLPLARELADVGIRVVTICPGGFHTPMLGSPDEKQRAKLARWAVFPQRLGTPAEFAHLVAAIVENPMLNGESIRLDAGTRLGHPV